MDVELNFTLAAPDEYVHHIEVSFQRNSDYWFELPIQIRIAWSIGLVFNIGIGMVGKFAVLKRISMTGITTYPINPLMFYNEIIHLVFRVSMMANMLLLIATGTSAKNLVDIFTTQLIGTEIPFCSWYLVFVIFAKANDTLGSFSVAVFR